MSAISILTCGCSITKQMDGEVTRLHLCSKHLTKLMEHLGCKNLEDVADKWREVLRDDA